MPTERKLDRDGDRHGDGGDGDRRNNRGGAHAMCEVVRAALEDAKGENIVHLDVRKLTDITDAMFVVTGASERHVRTLAERVLERMRAAGWRPLGVEGLEDADWVLVDFVDVVVHIMRAPARDKYDLEGLWDENFGALPAAGRDTGGG